MQLLPLTAAPLTQQAFAPFGTVIEAGLGEIRQINWDKTQRHHALACADVVGEDAQVLINVFRTQPWPLPLTITMMERHPLGSQAFMPLSGQPYLVVVAQDQDGRPQHPVAFWARADQGVNYHRNVWHHPLLALYQICDFLVVDRGGSGNNLEEYYYPQHNFILNDS